MAIRLREVTVPRLESWVISSNLYSKKKKKKCWSQSTGCHISSTLDELWAFNQSSGDSRASSPFNYISCSRYETKAEQKKKKRKKPTLSHPHEPSELSDPLKTAPTFNKKCFCFVVAPTPPPHSLPSSARYKGGRNFMSQWQQKDSGGPQCVHSSRDFFALGSAFKFGAGCRKTLWTGKKFSRSATKTRRRQVQWWKFGINGFSLALHPSWKERTHIYKVKTCPPQLAVAMPMKNTPVLYVFYHLRAKVEKKLKCSVKKEPCWIWCHLQPLSMHITAATGSVS